MFFKNIGYFFVQALKGITKNLWMTLASTGVTFITLFVLGAFMIVNANLQVIMDDIRNQAEILAYVEEFEDDEEYVVGAIEREIAAISEVEEYQYVSKDDALDRLEEMLGEFADITAGMDERNPLPASFELSVDDPEKIPVVAGRLERITYIESVDYGQDVLEQLLSITEVIQWVGLALMIILMVMALFLIANTIKLTVYARRKEINIMKYVGATNWFIRWPFILEGFLLSLVGTVLALLAIYYGYDYALVLLYESLPPETIQFSFVEVADIMEHLVKNLLMIGVGIGVVGSTLSLRKFLNV
ncbi:permease-like cell division protein FtsX [Proteinivorax hydrogeniformans]|uniref:Cell division protein FtsX n=1 Tax=Proteinivorax hydrogeniformans TaxID=1826727 RepID=A0AAU8HV42_9FIRM